MSIQPDPSSASLNLQTIQTIEELNLSVIKKHHVRILAHCLQTLKYLSEDKSFASDKDNLLREWCNNVSQRFNDQNFSNLFYEQLVSSSNMLYAFSLKIKKNFKDLDIEDLVLLVEESSKNSI
tara:strand:- start:260 stop:628 length:369 start_codon:yes stop_codon:yes gene_type:complete